MNDSTKLLLCQYCGIENIVESDVKKQSCSRCTLPMNRKIANARSKTLSFALTALIICPAAYLLPFMEIEIYGRSTEPTIWGGIVTLVQDGSWFIAGVIFLASLVIPVLKLVVLVGLVASTYRPGNQVFNTKLHYVVEQIGKWSMVDVFLLAILVAALKLGSWAKVAPREGAVMFAFVVIFTLISSACFDSRLLWQNGEEQKSP